MKARRIAHLDMDAFYASVELLKYPELKGLPVVVGGRRAHSPHVDERGQRVFARLRDYVGRGVLTTSTYEARALGLFSGMGTMKAAQLAPDAIILPVDFEAYRHYSRLFKEAVRAIAPKIEDRGIDEIYIDLTDIDEATEPLAQRIKAAVLAATGLSCSMGVSPNKLLSKMASEMQKPNGLTLIKPTDLKTRIWPLQVCKINGIGPKATQKLQEIGVLTIADLAKTRPEVLQQHFGLSYAQWLCAAAKGEDDRPVITASEPKSISRETTFDRDLHARVDRAALSEVLTRLAVQVSDDLHRKGYQSRTIGIKLRYADFSVVTRDISLNEPTADPALIRQTAAVCAGRCPLSQRIRLMGVRASHLYPAGQAPSGPSQAELPLDSDK